MLKDVEVFFLPLTEGRFMVSSCGVTGYCQAKHTGQDSGCLGCSTHKLARASHGVEKKESAPQTKAGTRTGYQSLLLKHTNIALAPCRELCHLLAHCIGHANS